jgi:predicted O-methyltransferase YrrM
MDIPYWRMGGITVPEVEEYAYSLLPPRDEVVAEIEADAASNNVPIVGPMVARLLYQLAVLSGAKRIFEMGSAIGYSTIWWARAVGEGGEVIYTDGDPQKANKARRYFERAGVQQRIKICTGDALELLSEQKEPFDIIFNDVDKHYYPRVLRLVAPKLRKGGLFITDNTLWSGRVARDAAPDDRETSAIQEFNRQLYTSPDFYANILPVRDGVTVAVRL